MNVKQLIKRLETMDKNKIVIYKDEEGGWDNIEIKETKYDVVVYTSGGSPFSDEK